MVSPYLVNHTSVGLPCDWNCWPQLRYVHCDALTASLAQIRRIRILYVSGEAAADFEMSRSTAAARRIEMCLKCPVLAEAAAATVLPLFTLHLPAAVPYSRYKINSTTVPGMALSLPQIDFV